LVARHTSTISLSAKPSLLALGSSLVLLAVMVMSAGLLIVGGQKYYAEMEYAKGIRFFQEGNVAGAIDTIVKSANLNSAVDLYWRDLSQLLLTRANQIASDQSLSQDARAQQTGIAVNNAVAAAKRAVQENPANVANWNVQGFVYRSFISVPGAERFAIQSYEKALELEPASPFPWTELGRVKILQAQVVANQEGVKIGGSERETLFASALADLEKAISLKGDYAPAHYLIAVAHDQQGNQAEAIKKLEETKLVAHGDVGLAFQLGVAYYRLEKLARARDEFERAKSLDLRNSNVRYMLGLVYDRLGRKADAEVEFGVVLSGNPQNQEVKDILENLREGRAALYGIIPNQPPIEETPSEIEK
jgi:tetratricopeptide (TPR) repeat protein